MTEEIDTSVNGRAYPDAVDGLPQNANESQMVNEISDDGFIHDDLDNDNNYAEEKSIPAVTRGKKLDTAIVKGVEKIIKLKADRTNINTRIKEIVEGLEAQGILRDSLKDTIKKLEWTEAKRESYKLGCNISASALGIMEQAELFEVK